MPLTKAPKAKKAAKTSHTTKSEKTRLPVRAKKTRAALPKSQEKEISETLELAEEVASQAAKGGSYIPAIGRRKTSVARVRLVKNGKGLITVNGREFLRYFTTYELREQVTAPLNATGQTSSVDVSIRVEGGGMRGQAEAIRQGIARALIQLNPTFRAALKKLGYLTRDARKRERKKFGLKSARRAPQWSKR